GIGRQVLRDGSERQSQHRCRQRGRCVQGRPLPRDRRRDRAPDSRGRRREGRQGRMTSRFTLPAFAAYGIELEYVIVDAATLDVAPLAEPLLAVLQGHRSQPALTDWSNELVSHVVELKNPAPAPSLGPLPDAFQRE